MTAPSGGARADTAPPAPTSLREGTVSAPRPGGIFFQIALTLLLLAAILGARSLAQTAAEHDSSEAPAAESPAGLSDAQRSLQSGSPAAKSEEESFDFFSEEPVQSAEIVELPPQKPAWQTIGGPIALIGLFFFILLFFWWMVPFREHTLDVNLHELPTGAKRGIAMAVGMFGVAFVFGASEIWYQLKLHGSAEAYFAQMSLGKLIAFTHAHLFGFTTSFFIIGIPFSMQFNHLWPYQWVFPIGLSASVTDVISWWGIKYVSSNFEWVSVFCGILFSLSYLYMLIGLQRVLLFPEVIWRTDKDRAERLAQRQAIRDAARYEEGDV